MGMAEPQELLEGKTTGSAVAGSPQRSTHLSTCSRSCPGLCLILVCASTLSISAALSPLMVTMMSPGRRSPAAAFPCSITSMGHGDGPGVILEVLWAATPPLPATP